MSTSVPNGLFKPELWSKEILRNLDDTGVMVSDCVNRDYEGEVKNAGDTVHIQQAGNITINTHDDSQAITYQDADGETTSLVVNQKKNFGFVIYDIDKVQANVELMARYTSRAKKAISLVKDSYLLGVGTAGVASANKLGSVTLTKDNAYETFVALFEKLAASNAIDANGKGEDGLRPFLVLPPQVISVIKLSPEAANATTLGNDTIRKGAIMQYAGFDIKQATNLKDAEGVYTVLAGTKEGITYAEQIAKIRGLEDKDYFGTFVSGLYVYGAKVVQPTALASAAITLTSPSPTT